MRGFTLPHTRVDAARQRPRISSIRLRVIPPSGMQFSRLEKALSTREARASYLLLILPKIRVLVVRVYIE